MKITIGILSLVFSLNGFSSNKIFLEQGFYSCNIVDENQKELDNHAFSFMIFNLEKRAVYCEADNQVLEAGIILVLESSANISWAKYFPEGQIKGEEFSSISNRPNYLRGRNIVNFVQNGNDPEHGVFERTTIYQRSFELNQKEENKYSGSYTYSSFSEILPVLDGERPYPAEDIQLAKITCHKQSLQEIFGSPQNAQNKCEEQFNFVKDFYDSFNYDQP